MEKSMKVRDFFNLDKTAADKLLLSSEYPWDAIDMLSEYIARVGRGLLGLGFNEIKRGVWVSDSARISDSAILTSPLIIDSGAQISDHSIVRSSIIGKETVVGSFCEVFDSILFDRSSLSQHNYVSDSIIGYRARFGAGAIVSSRSADSARISCLFGDELISCNRRRFGVVVGDDAEVGCSSVLTAGCIVERGACVRPLTRVRGFISASGSYSGEKIRSAML